MTKRNTDLARTLALVEVLQTAQVHNEEGEMLLNFTDQGRDCLDFANINRATLLSLMTAAYEAGVTAGKRDAAKNLNALTKNPAGRM